MAGMWEKRVMYYSICFIMFRTIETRWLRDSGGATLLARHDYPCPLDPRSEPARARPGADHPGEASAARSGCSGHAAPGHRPPCRRRPLAGRRYDIAVRKVFDIQRDLGFTAQPAHGSPPATIMGSDCRPSAVLQFQCVNTTLVSSDTDVIICLHCKTVRKIGPWRATGRE
jgi:hypothetical protein